MLFSQIKVLWIYIFLKTYKYDHLFSILSRNTTKYGKCGWSQNTSDKEWDATSMTEYLYLGTACVQLVNKLYWQQFVSINRHSNSRAINSFVIANRMALIINRHSIVRQLKCHQLILCVIYYILLFFGYHRSRLLNCVSTDIFWRDWLFQLWPLNRPARKFMSYSEQQSATAAVAMVHCRWKRSA